MYLMKFIISYFSKRNSYLTMIQAHACNIENAYANIVLTVFGDFNHKLAKISQTISRYEQIGNSRIQLIREFQIYFCMDRRHSIIKWKLGRVFKEFWHWLF